MLLLKETLCLSEPLLGSILDGSPLWHRDVTSITHADILAFVAKRRRRPGSLWSGEARQAVDRLLFEIRKAVKRGEVPQCELATISRHSYGDRFSRDDLNTALAFMPAVNRRAITFALEQRLELDDVERLRWVDAKKMNLTVRGQEILHNQPRHIRSPFVFWRDKGNGPVPVRHMRVNFKSMTAGVSWVSLQARYQRMVNIDFDQQYEADMVLAKQWF